MERFMTDEMNALAGQTGLIAEYLQQTAGPHSDFDNLAALAVQISGVQACLINLVDTDIQWTVGSCGSPLTRFTTDESVCQFTILQDLPLEVKDLTSDDRFNCMKSIQRSGLRYYYGIPLSTPEGRKIGALCVLDPQPQKLSTATRQLLNKLADEAAKKLETLRALNRLRLDLDEAVQVKRMLAHDIRGPLHGIQGLSRLALEDLQQNKNDELPVYLEHIAQSGHSLLYLTDGILATEAAADQANLSFGSLRQQVCRLLMPVVRQKGIRFTFQLPQPLASMPVKHHRLLQAVINLAGNAIKFTPENGIISLKLGIRRMKAQSFLCLTVTDDGIGMSEEIRQRILSGSHTSTPGTLGEAGSGLGLRMIQDWLKASCGRLRVTSVLGEGTTFNLIVPYQ